MTGKLIVARQGQNEGAAMERFVGRTDYRLTYLGRKEARGIGRQLREGGLSVSDLFAAPSRQAEESAEYVQKELGLKVLVTLDEALSERDCGDVTNMSKEQAIDFFGAREVLAWKRSFDHAYPAGESLRDVRDRLWPLFETDIQPKLQQGKDILILCDSDCARALSLELEELTPQQVETVDFECGQVIVYAFGEGGGHGRALDRSSRERPRLSLVSGN